MSAPFKTADTLTTLDISAIQDEFIKAYVNVRVPTQDRTESQNFMVRTWYTAVTNYLASQEGAVNTNQQGDKAN